MISFKLSGSFDKTENFFKRVLNSDHKRLLDKYGALGVAALTDATPKDSGETSKSWSYSITNQKNSLSLHFHNSNVVDGTPIALIIQYGHLSVSKVYVQGKYVPGIDYINPALKPMFDSLSAEIWKEVTRP